jgi:hypothetical protein
MGPGLLIQRTTTILSREFSYPQLRLYIDFGKEWTEMERCSGEAAWS